MNLTGFTDQQKQTLLDLLVIGMYADGNLADAEDAKIEAVLDTIKFPSEFERGQFVDASFTRARQNLGSPQSTRDFVADIAKHFPTPDIRRKAYDDLEELLSSDNKIVDKENQLLAIVKEEFKLWLGVLFEAVLEANHRAASDDQQVVLEQVPALKKAMSKDDDKGK